MRKPRGFIHFHIAMRLLLALALVAAMAAQAAKQLPRVEGESFAGQKVVLPDAARDKVAVLIFGFTKASKEPTSAWARKIHLEFGTRSGFALYQLPVLESVPRFIRGMVISSIKKGVPEDMRAHFVPILQDEAELKKLVNYKETDDAYLVVLDHDGQIALQRHGAFSEAAYGQFRDGLQGLLERLK